MLFTALGGAYEVGASCHLLQIAGRNILLDAGLRPSARGERALPDLEKLEGLTRGRLDLVLVSHAHMDHTGALPLVRRRFPATPIYCTAPTKRIAEILLLDTIRIMRADAEEDRAEFPLFDAEEVEQTVFGLRPQPFDEWFEPVDGLRIYFHRSGHIVGAAAILLQTSEGAVVYSGDISVASQRTVSGMAPIGFFRPDVLVLEGTYGDAAHPARKEQEQKLARAVAEVVQQGGTVLIPSFALGRAQEVLLILKSSMMGGLIPRFPIYADGLVRSICDVYTDLLYHLPDRLRKYVENSQQPVFWSSGRGNIPQVTRLAASERITMFTGEPKCIIASSGMLVGGPSAYYARVLAVEPKNAIFLTGYQDEESPGRRLMELQTGDTLSVDDEEIVVKCRVAKYSLSAHADQIQLCQQVSYMNPTSIILVHGEPGPLQSLRHKLMDKHVVFAPLNGDTFDPLAKPEWMTDAKRQFLDVERARFAGEATFDGSGVTIRFGDDLAASEAWRQFFQGYERVEARFMGRRLLVKPIAPNGDEAPDDE
jgi:Cft2 family RNA processing exonuclease